VVVIVRRSFMEAKAVHGETTASCQDTAAGSPVGPDLGNDLAKLRMVLALLGISDRLYSLSGPFLQWATGHNITRNLYPQGNLNPQGWKVVENVTQVSDIKVCTERCMLRFHTSSPSAAESESSTSRSCKTNLMI
jgi:hypothetical protein